MDINELLFTPNDTTISSSEMTKFMHFFEDRIALKFKSYTDFHQYSVANAEQFWFSCFEYFKVSYKGQWEPICQDMTFKTYGWFPNIKLNFAKNLLVEREENTEVIRFVHESQKKVSIKFKDLKKSVLYLQNFLDEFISIGDVVGAYMPNIPETLYAMLATTSLGGVFTSTSSDFGIEGVVDRFSESKPKVLIAAVEYSYANKVIDQRSKILEIKRRLPSVEKVILVNFLTSSNDQDRSIFKDPCFYFYDDLQSNSLKYSEIKYVDVSFQHPLYIMYSSGTTGKPKGIVHSTGGVLLKHLVELGPHSNMKEGKTIFFFTTCGWMMWNWLMSALYFKGVIVLYEGSPAEPSPEYFFHMIDREKINLFGTSPKFLKALQDHDSKFSKLESLECILSTGSPLLPEQYDYVYTKIKRNVHLSSISGGTDILGCFMLGNPNLSVGRGLIQCLALGMDVAALSEDKSFVFDQEAELICKKSFVTRPIYFLNDINNAKLKEAYFNQNPPYWTHGDYVKISQEGAVQVFGRSDATLNPGGVRIGTSEIYRQTETLTYIQDSICAGKTVEGDVEVCLFIKMRLNEELTSDRKKEIKELIKKNTSPRHVPKVIAVVKDIPYTRSGKKVELAIAKILSKKPLNNIEAISNPECLSEYEQFA